MKGEQRLVTTFSMKHIGKESEKLVNSMYFYDIYLAALITYCSSDIFLVCIQNSE